MLLAPKNRKSTSSFTKIFDYLLTFVETPSVINCMPEIKRLGTNYYLLKEGGNLSTTCLVHGVPTPFLQCYLLNTFGKVDSNQISSKEKRNFTESIGKRLQFQNVSRSVVKMECELDGGSFAGKTKYSAPVVVNCKYFKSISVTVKSDKA